MRIKYYIKLFSILALLCLFNNCSKEVTENQSGIITISAGVGESSVVPYYTVDNSGKYLFIFIRDFFYSTTKILKINLSDLRLEKQLTFEGVTNTTVPIMFENIVVTDRNELIGGFYNFYTDMQLLIKFDADLNVLKVDSLDRGMGGSHGRTRLVKSGPGKITGIYEHRDSISGRWYLRYQHMDEDLNILSQVTDTSSFYGDGPLAPQNFIQTSDGGFLFDAYDYVNGDAIIEKRNADFKLLWRTRYSGPMDPRSLNELNGKYLVYCYGDSVFTLTYDLNGNLLGKYTYNVDGATLKKETEPMRKTDHGEFLITARIVYNNNRRAQTGILFHADENGRVISSKTFGSNRLLGSFMVKVRSDRYLVFYLDNYFQPDGASQPRFVFRYVDAKGNFIE